jgi:hypothetical protein
MAPGMKEIHWELKIKNEKVVVSRQSTESYGYNLMILCALKLCSAADQ